MLHFGFGFEQKAKEMKMVGTMAAEKGWLERGVVGLWRIADWSMVVVGCGFEEKFCLVCEKVWENK